jgi:hypothetical protein
MAASTVWPSSGWPCRGSVASRVVHPLGDWHVGAGGGQHDAHRDREHHDQLVGYAALAPRVGGRWQRREQIVGNLAFTGGQLFSPLRVVAALIRDNADPGTAHAARSRRLRKPS